MLKSFLSGRETRPSTHSDVAQAHPFPDEQESQEAHTDEAFQSALDSIPCNAMYCDRDLILRFLNRSSLQTLKTLQNYLPCPVDQIVGNSIHIFHRNPENMNQILGAGANPLGDPPALPGRQTEFDIFGSLSKKLLR